MIDTSEKFRWLVRLGFGTRGVVYVLVGYLALTAGGGEGGPEQVLAYVRDAPLGEPLLYLAALGLLGYALYRLCSLLFDIENYGVDGSGIAHRVGHGASGVAHFLLAYAAFQLAQGSPAASGGGAEQAAATVLSFTFGSLVLGAIGLGFLVAAVMQVKKALSASFTRRIASGAPRIVEHLGRAGYAARAVVFLIIGWSLVRSAWFASTARVKTLGEAIASLADNGTMYTLVAVGLLLFGIFSLFLARYRIVPDLNARDLKPSLR